MKTDFTKLSDMTAVQRAKLPAYARDYIEMLERTVHETEHTLYEETSRLGPRAYVGGKLTDARHEPPYGVIIDPNGPHPLAVHEKFTCRFWMPGTSSERWIDVRIARSGTSIELMGATSLEVQPMSSNMMTVKVRS